VQARAERQRDREQRAAARALADAELRAEAARDPELRAEAARDPERIQIRRLDLAFEFWRCEKLRKLGTFNRHHRGRARPEAPRRHR
jgi:hypothetical protein